MAADILDDAANDQPPPPPPRPPARLFAEGSPLGTTPPSLAPPSHVDDDAEVIGTERDGGALSPPVFGPRTSSRNLRRSSSAFLNLDVSKELSLSPVLSTLQAEADSYVDLLTMLNAGKAVLFLPVTDSLVSRGDPVSAIFFETHVFVPNPANPVQLMSLGGIRALLKGDRLIIVGPRLSERELLATWSNHPQGKKRTLWDTIDVNNTSPDHFPSIPILSDIPTDVTLTHEYSVKVMIISRAIMTEDLEHSPSTSPSKPRSKSGPNATSILPSFELPFSPSNVLEQLSSIPSALFNKTENISISNLDDAPALREDPNFVALKHLTEDSQGNWLIAETQRFIGGVGASGQRTTVEALVADLEGFLDGVQSRLKKALGSDMPDIGSVLDGLESYVHIKSQRIYFGAVQREEAATDVFVQRRISLLAISGFGLQHLGLSTATGKEQMDALEETVRLAGIEFSAYRAKELIRCDMAVTPKAKLERIVKCHQIVADGTSSADMLLPLLIYVVVRSVKRRHSELWLTETEPMLRQNKSSSPILSSASAVHSYLETVDVSMMDLPPDLTGSPLMANSTEGSATSEKRPLLTPGSLGDIPALIEPPSSAVLQAITDM
ncbi:hypothetical protein HK104_010737 [Borealophlyctis nickersoniae]|nr:hypothetical protein HK104_010737 [Borealophlyctis nickersoniae]